MKRLIFGAAVSLFISLVFLILSFLLPALYQSDYYQHSLDQLKDQASLIRKEFSHVMDRIDAAHEFLSEQSIPSNKNDLFDLFKSVPLDLQEEGIAYYSKEGDPVLWYGKVLDLRSVFEVHQDQEPLEKSHASFLVYHKASAFLISAKKTKNNGHIVLFRLLAFLPQLKAPYLRESHFLSSKLLNNCSVDYWDFREDLTGFEQIFARHNDLYIGQPRLQDEVQTIFFPLRTPDNKIIATITLSSPPLRSWISTKREGFLLFFFILFILSMSCLLSAIVSSPAFRKKQNLLPGGAVILLILGLRFLFFPLSQLEKVQSLQIFSPASASFLSLWDLTKSPCDIFLSSAAIFSILLCILSYAKRPLSSTQKKPSVFFSFLSSLLSTLFAMLMTFAFIQVLRNIVFHSNVDLFRFSFTGPFILLHLSLFILFLGLFLAIYAGFRSTVLFSTSPLLTFLILTAVFCAALFFTHRILPPLFFFVQGFILAGLLVLAYFPHLFKKKRVILSSCLITICFLYLSIQSASSEKKSVILQDSLKNLVTTQEKWREYVIRQTVDEMDERLPQILSSLRENIPENLAHELWKTTLMAKFNWYSSLEVLDGDGNIFSRFSLNVPESYDLNLDLPLSEEWLISTQKIMLLGKEKDLLVGYKDLFAEDEYLGRLLVYLSIDYEMLPFIYSANPYFELLRTTSIPSLNQFDLKFAVFDEKGKLVFNPGKISSGISLNTLRQILTSDDSVWAAYSDKGRIYNSLFFKNNGRIFSFFLPRKNLFNYSVEFLKFFFLELAFFLILAFVILVLFEKVKIKNPLWSYSNRVYISFVVIALIPFLLFTLSTQSFFSTVYTQQITEKAESFANFAQRVMADFIAVQQEEQMSLTVPPDFLVMWISSTISNDVNLYQDGRMISSSRREFFDYGLLPDLINGEIYYKIQYENNPFYSLTQQIGDYSFNTLTIPYFLEESLFLISLPFPLEQQEISKATEVFIDFIFFISFFFITIALIFARGIGGMIVTPIQKLLLGTKEVSLGNFEFELEHKHKDEMKNLIDGFNAMVQNLKLHQQELAEMSKKVAWAEIAKKVAHEIKNPLTPIQLSAEHLLQVYEDKEENFEETLKESAATIIKEVENLRKTAQEFFETSQEAEMKRESIDLKEIIQETIEPYKKTLANRIDIKEEYRGGRFLISGDKEKVKIVLRNIFTNAIEALHDRGHIMITVSSKDKHISCEIKDTGVGISRENLKRIFEPYFTTKTAGTGLGLAIAKQIIEDHGGTINAYSEEKKGTNILITLPKSETSSSSPD